MSPATPVTQRDVAQACGVHHSTVCLALKNSPALGLETRFRIQAAARELGYQPNVSAQNLATMRKERTPNVSLPLAWVNQEAARNFWRTRPNASELFNAARRLASEQGYHFDEFWAHEPGMSVARMPQILRARGIRGAIFPVYQHGGLDLGHPAWDDVSCVALNDHRLAQWIDVVSPDYSYLIDLVLRQLTVRTPRVALALDREFDEVSNGLIRSRYLRYQDDLAPAQRLPVYILDHDFANTKAFAEWSNFWRPDVLICRDDASAQSLGADGVEILTLQRSAVETADLFDEETASLAAAAVESVTRKIQRFETGVGGPTRIHLIRSLTQFNPAFQRGPVPRVRLPSLAA